jgi:hypothetical protein
MVTLPKPNDGFHWTQLSGKPVLVCDALEPFAAHFFTTREWRLGDRTPESRDGWDEVAEAADVDAWHLGRLHQVHAADAVTYKKGGPIPGGVVPAADIVLTDDPSVAIAVQTADCLPILIVDRETGAVAAAHAGWRGLARGVPTKAVIRLTFGSGFDGRPRNLLVAVGPAIGACCYEVGEEVRARFADGWLAEGESLDKWFRAEPAKLPTNPPMRTLVTTRRTDHWFFDTWTCVRDQLEDVGVPRDQIFIADLCTASHDAFCSYRRDGAMAGRTAGVIRSKK